MNPVLLALIPAVPFLGALANYLIGRRLGRAAVHAIAIGSAAASCLLALAFLRGFVGIPAPVESVAAPFFNFGGVEHPWAFRYDALTAVMASFVTFIALLIHLYSAGYMARERDYARFFIYLNLFLGSMLTLVLGASLPVLFVGWEGVGACSYLLIGFHADRLFDAETGQTCADAGRKAFLTNRIGDFCFVSGMLILLANFGDLNFTGLEAALRANASSPAPVPAALLTAAAILLFLGATAKSAQIPLYVWLPDAMAGPTPVSALIHAATMVTAGIYMLCRLWFLFAQLPVALAVIALTGAATALFAATMGCAATDIKKVLAYSTVSQLGYMFLGVGAGAPAAGLFHVFTHAFFKALLFLGAGSVIHALSGEQDIRRMGRLWGRIPLTAWTFLVGVLAISGVPGLSGFFSKDAILHHAFMTGTFAAAGVPWLRLPVFLAALATAGLTAFYMFRLFFLVFRGEDRVAAEAKAHIHESPWTMTLPLALLSVGAAVAGYLSADLLGLKDHWGDFLAANFPIREIAEGGAAAPLPLAALSVAVAAGGILIAWRNYAAGDARAAAFAERHPGLLGELRGKWFVDELYETLLLAPARRVASWSETFDRWIVDGAVNAAAFAHEVLGMFLRFAQTGKLRDYALALALGGGSLLLWAILKF